MHIHVIMLVICLMIKEILYSVKVVGEVIHEFLMFFSYSSYNNKDGLEMISEFT